jgi:lipopolysaccharide transport system permease protein
VNQKNNYEILIEPGQGIKRYWKDIWEYRELLAFLAWRDILVRYKQTVIGVTWSIIRPLLTMIVFTVVFGNIAHLPSEGIPYPIMVYAAMLPWQLFASALTEAGNSMISNANIISKVFFPRLIIPASTVLVCLVDFFTSFILLFCLMFWFKVWPSLYMLMLPIFLLMALAFAFGSGLWVAALNVKYRDFRYIVPFAVQFGLYISPVGFSSNVVPEHWRLIYSLNPMVGVIDGFRWAITSGGTHLDWGGLVISLIVNVGFLVTGIWYFRKTEKTFADLI